MGRRHLLVATATGMLALATALPASATTGTITVTVGSLSITAPTDAGNLATKAETVGAMVISGTLGVVLNRVLGAGPAIAASLVSYTAGAIVKVGTATYTANNPPDLTGVAPAVTATGITGDNSATWNPTISVAVPGGTAAGVYSAIITHSIV